MMGGESASKMKQILNFKSGRMLEKRGIVPVSENTLASLENSAP
jgi:hypothetical protein